MPLFPQINSCVGACFVRVITWIRVRFGNNCMSNRQGNCISEASVILPIANAITPKSHENACD